MCYHKFFDSHGFNPIFQKKLTFARNYLYEKTLRIWALIEAKIFFQSGVSVFSNLTGLSRVKINRRLKMLKRTMMI